MDRVRFWVAAAFLMGLCGDASGEPRRGMARDVKAAEAPRAGAGSFVNWENHPTHGLDITPDGATLLAVNLPDNRLEVFDLTGGGPPAYAASIPVGLDPVSVRARTNTEVWVVNHISDSISIVDLASMNAVRTIGTKDEPCDVVFAGSPLRAFVTCSQANLVQVFDPAAPGAAVAEIAIKGEDPRALSVSPDGLRVYAAVFESGNASTVLGGGDAEFPPAVVNNPAGPYAGQNPPPNDGSNFNPPIAPQNQPALEVSLIVKKDELGRWMDDNSGDWTNFVSGPSASASGRVPGWDVPDRDLAIIDTGTLSVTYATGLMNMCMAVGVNPATGRVAVVGTDAINEIRYEPNVRGIFVRVLVAQIDPNGGNKAVVDLNPHLNYLTPTVPQGERDKSIGDARAIVWNAAGQRGYVAGMGSDNVVVIDSAGARAGLSDTIEVGEGPTSLVLDEARSLLYVLNRFEGSISVVDTTVELETARVSFFDPTPTQIKIGRRHLFSTHDTSGLGQASCASCHVDARTDRLAWDLGNPQGTPRPLNGTQWNLVAGLINVSPIPFHAMKGPMTTQTLQDIIGHEPLHWRGDRLGLEEFNPAFISLMGDDAALTPSQMQEFEDFLATIHFPPNPFRELDNTLPDVLPLPAHYSTGRYSPAGTPLPEGRPNVGLALFPQVKRISIGGITCITCHTLPTGAGTDMTWTPPLPPLGGPFAPIPSGPNGEHHLMLTPQPQNANFMKVPQLRSLYEKVGMEMTKTESIAGFGFGHDGDEDSLARLISVDSTVASDQEIADIVAFFLCVTGSDLPPGSLTNPANPPGTPSKDAHAAVGRQTTLAAATPAQLQLISAMVALAEAERVGLVVKGRVAGLPRGYAYAAGGSFQSDRAAELLSPAQLQALASPGAELTFTVVPEGTQVRIGIDRDGDGHYDRDELEGCADPADPASYPGAPGNPDCNGDGLLTVADFGCFQTKFVQGDPYADCTQSGALTVADFGCFQTKFVQGCP